ncbi:hypothetical protein J2S40_001820 [Nocardioides luteus]|uniref:Uncharacterized protein n=1 Tax=Nocardioides luteus TaxID=1844 RepID=A0ABQ5T0W6_9ACTN|nr:hypothetical protein [Nocardioides luteus]MDR7310762.1 hypothetical protein [Nocardioides luteus]GGR40768.1 hypothetical protein GCM10010197_02340 [Nocardioides luteus]GLJ69458.1 hypothetical protein GCM10017579_34940 [Nocardioides luteus]
MSEGLDRLAATLGVPTTRLAPLEAYDDEQLRRFDDLTQGAMRAEDEAFDASLNQALRMVPKMLRGVVQRMLGGAR